MGAYDWREASLKWVSSRARPFYWQADLATGGFYDGTRDCDGATLASGPLAADIGRLRVRDVWSTRLFRSAFVQYDVRSNTLVTNARLNFRYAPLSDIFLVYTDRRNQETGTLGERTLALKVTRMLAF